MCPTLVVTAVIGLAGTLCGMSYAKDLTDKQWALLELVFNSQGKRGPEHATDLRSVVNAAATRESGRAPKRRGQSAVSSLARSPGTPRFGSSARRPAPLVS